MQENNETKKIWLEFNERLHHYIRRTVKTEEDARDVLQEVFVKISKNAQRLDAVESLSGWVYQITRNAIADHFRRHATNSRSLDRASQEATLGEGQASEVDDAGSEALAKCIRPLLQRLPEQYRDALEMTELGEFSQKEAAEKIGISVSGMKSRVQRGRTKFKEILLDCCSVQLDARQAVFEFEKKMDCDCKGCD